MLSISTTEGLSILDSITIKRTPPLVPPCLTLTHKVVASTWSSDNAFLFLASLQTIQRYDPSSNSLEEFYSNIGEGDISHLVFRDKGSLIFSSGEIVHLLDCGSIPKVSHTFDTHKSMITSLSLSNDASLLSSTSSTAAHVHNLSLASHTVLKGLPLGSQPITASVFHPQLRTRLLLGVGKQLVVYDTTRPSGPMRTIALNETNSTTHSGDIIAIACSPFSKTLVAVATTGGNVVLIDLEKEKGLIRTLNLKVPLTSLEFSPEGAAIYAGTENGKLLITDLRGLDKGPKTIVISDAGSRIECMCIQKKTRGSIDPNAKQLKSKSSTDLNGVRRVTQTSKPAAKAAPSPSHACTARVGSEASPARRVPPILKEGPPGPSPKRTADPESKKKVFSPVRDPLGNSGSADDISVEIETLVGLKIGVKATPKKSSTSVPRSRTSLSPKVNPSPTSTSAKTITSRTARPATAKEDSAEAPRRARTLPTTTRTRKTSTTDSVDSRPAAPQLLQVPTKEIRQQLRMASSSSHPGSSASAVSSQSTHPRPEFSGSNSRPGSSTSRAESSPIPPLPASGTVSPDLPAVHGEPTTPVPMAKKRKGMSVLGLGTPEVEHWIRAGKGDIEGIGNDKGKGKGKTVGFMDDNDSENEHGSEGEQGLAMQVSPRRSTDVSNPVSTSWAPAPLHLPVPGSGSPAGGAHDLLRTIVRDVMYDFQRETKAEMMGLHLDLVRMGRGWKKELRDLMGEYVGDLKDLREENRRLREENERLKRGY